MIIGLLTWPTCSLQLSQINKIMYAVKALCGGRRFGLNLVKGIVSLTMSSVYKWSMTVKWSVSVSVSFDASVIVSLAVSTVC